MAQLTRGRTLAAAFLLGGASLAPLSLSMPALAADDLTLRRVLLSTGGVGYFEYEAEVDGDAALTLDVRLDQVDDVMKSVVIYDDRGTIGDISLPGREPLREIFRDLPFGPEALNSPVALLSAMQGAQIRVAGARAMTGRIVSVTSETAVSPDGDSVLLQNRVSLMTEDGLQQIILEDTDTIQFVDDTLQSQLNAALEAVARHNTPDRRSLDVRVAGTGQRTIRVGYVIETPLWKTSYRLTLDSAESANSAGMQGWAVLENLSGEDWTDIELTVASGNPVTFRQALYESYFVYRPEVPVEVLGRVLPPADTSAPSVLSRIQPEQLGGGRFDDQERSRTAMLSEGFAADAAPPPMAQVMAASSDESTTQVVFRFPGAVTVTNGDSILLPVISRDLPGERLSLYQPDTDPTHPLASIRMTNDSESGLPPGVLTLYERSAQSGAVAYIGDARLGPLPAGEERLLSYAIDQKVRIDQETQLARTITAGKIVDGVFDITLTQRQTTDYTVTGAARESRTVLIEHPRYNGWTLIPPEGLDGDEPVESTATHYRLRVALDAGETKTLSVSMEQPLYERHQMTNLSKDQIAVFRESRELSPAVRQAMADLAAHQATLVDMENTERNLVRQLNTVIEDQGRLRDNLRSVPGGSDLHQRYLGKMTEQEDQIDGLRIAIDDARNAVLEARQVVTDFVRGLNV